MHTYHCHSGVPRKQLYCCYTKYDSCTFWTLPVKPALYKNLSPSQDRIPNAYLEKSPRIDYKQYYGTENYYKQQRNKNLPLRCFTSRKPHCQKHCKTLDKCSLNASCSLYTTNDELQSICDQRNMFRFAPLMRVALSLQIFLSFIEGSLVS